MKRDPQLKSPREPALRTVRERSPKEKVALRGGGIGKKDRRIALSRMPNDDETVEEVLLKDQLAKAEKKVEQLQKQLKKKTHEALELQKEVNALGREAKRLNEEREAAKLQKMDFDLSKVEIGSITNIRRSSRAKRVHIVCTITNLGPEPIETTLRIPVDLFEKLSGPG